MKKSTPIFLTIIAILFVVVLYLLYLNFTKTPTPSITSITPTTGIIPTEAIVPTAIPTINPTANWKTLANTKYGFSFLYPPTGKIMGSTLQPQIDLGSRQAFAVTLNYSGMPGGCTEVVSTTKITVGGIVANKTTEKGISNDLCGMADFTENNITFTYNNNEYVLNMMYPTTLTTQAQITLDQILSTFKFTSPSSDLTSLIKSTAATEAKTTVNQVIVGETKIVGNYAQVAFNYTTGGGAIYWTAKVNGSWKIVTGGQEPPACSTLLSYGFPADFECNK